MVGGGRLARVCARALTHDARACVRSSLVVSDLKKIVSHNVDCTTYMRLYVATKPYNRTCKPTNRACQEQITRFSPKNGTKRDLRKGRGRMLFK